MRAPSADRCRISVPSALLAAFLTVLCGPAGCSRFIDDVTSRDFKVRDLVSSPDPLTVLRTSKDGDARARAMRNLKEPRKHSKSPDEQDEAIRHLTEAATSDGRPLCRLAAVQALGRFEDPRTAAILVRAYEQAAALNPDAANAVRSETLAALGKKRNADAKESYAAISKLLIQIAADAKPTEQPNGPRPASFNSIGIDPTAAEHVTDRDLRIAAIKALGETKDHNAVPVLLPLLSEKDAAIRNRAHEALQSITGRKDMPPDPEIWKKAVGQEKESSPPRPTQAGPP